MFDIGLSLVTIAPQQYARLEKSIKESNLPKSIYYELMDILNTAVQQTGQAKKMGWINENDLIDYG